MRLVLLVVFFIVAFMLAMLAIAFPASLIAGRSPKMRADMEDEGCSCTFGLIGLVSIVIAGIATVPVGRWLFREEERLGVIYRPMVERVLPLYRRAAFVPLDPAAKPESPRDRLANRGDGPFRNPASHRHGEPPVAGARGILVLWRSEQGTVSLDAGRMADLDETCRAPPEEMPRFVISAEHHSRVIGHRVGAMAGAVYSYWSDVYLIDFEDGDTLYARSSFKEGDDALDVFLERAKAEGGCVGPPS